jgi:hypothetical protein
VISDCTPEYYSIENMSRKIKFQFLQTKITNFLDVFFELRPNEGLHLHQYLRLIMISNIFKIKGEIISTLPKEENEKINLMLNLQSSINLSTFRARRTSNFTIKLKRVFIH